MPTASGLGFVDREHPPPRMIVRNDASPLSPPIPIKYVPTQPERLACCLLITTVVLGAIGTLSWFVVTFEHS